MTDFNTLEIEQDPKCDARFRITVSESEIGIIKVAELDAYVIQHEYAVSLLKQRLGRVATTVLADHPAIEWVRQHGGRKQLRNITYRRKGEGYYRLGYSVTFKERDRAALFKLAYVGR